MATLVELGAPASTQASKIGRSSKVAVNAAGMFPRNGPDLTARSWSHHDSGITFAAQHKLPKQPLPSLESSCKKYLEALKTLQSVEEQEASAAAVKNFLHGEGPILQAQLKEYDNSQANYFEHYCEWRREENSIRKPDTQRQAMKVFWVMIRVSSLRCPDIK